MTYGNAGTMGQQQWGPQGPDKSEKNKKTNKKVLKWILIVLGVLVLVSMCTSALSDDEMDEATEASATTSEVTTTSETPEPTPESTRNLSDDTVVPAPSPEPEIDEDELKKIVYLSQVSEFNPPSDDDALIVAYSTCALLNSGSSVEDLILEVVLAGDDRIIDWVSNDDLPAIQGAAIGTHCPQHMDQLEKYAN